MAEPPAGWLQAGFRFRDHLNSDLSGPELENRTALVRAYERFGHAVNVPRARSDDTSVPESVADQEAYVRGLGSAFRGGGKTWL